MLSIARVYYQLKKEIFKDFTVMKQAITAVGAPIDARIIVPGSKSITNRALLLAALADGVSEIFDVLISADTLAFMQALRSLGVVVQTNLEERSCIVAGCAGHFQKKHATVWCEDAGTVARFLIAACAASSGGVYDFDGSKRLRERPISALLKTLMGQGAKFMPVDAQQMPFTMIGLNGLSGGAVEIEGHETSQFISALLMVAPFAKQETILKTISIVSQSYVDMTCEIMADFGVLVRRMHNGRFSVPVPQRYAARDYVVEPDLSTASYFFAAAAVTGGRITIQPLSRTASKQGDVEFLSVLEKMGCQVDESVLGLSVHGPDVLKGVSVNMMHFSDTFMTLAALAPFANSPTTITNIGHTRLQESNRISAMREGLELLGVRVEEGPDWIRVHPGAPRAGEINSHRDHRIAMAFSIIGLKVRGVVIDGAECVAKTCPDFFTLWQDLNSVKY
jgi:3-phosphoshikimate 1-carboxyvinyltransferase